MQNRCPKKLCKKYGKLCQNGSQMEAKIAWKSKNMRKKAWRKSMLKFYAEKKANPHFEITFWLDFWSGPGGKGGGWIQYKISERLLLGFHTPCTPGGVRRMKIYAQMEPKSHPKIAVWAIKGPTFEVFGSVLRNAFFLMIFEVCKNRLKMRKVWRLGGLGRFTVQLWGGSAAEAVVLGTWFY